MKGVKLWLLGTAVVLTLAIVGCAPGYSIKPGIAHNIVEVTANSTDSDLEDLASWCNDNDILMLWYDFDSQPSGFDGRKTVFEMTVADKNVYIDNQYAGNYNTSNIEAIESSITSLKVTLSGTLILYLKANDLLGTSWDLIIGESGETKVAQTSYVLVEFQKTANNVYEVNKVQVGDWNSFTVPKNITASNLVNKGFAFFKIDGNDGNKVVDARVIYP